MHHLTEHQAHADDRDVRQHGHGTLERVSAPQPHRHGVADPAYLSSARGLWALKWSFVFLGAGALLQMVVVELSGSLALLADMIHNFADAGTAVPLAVAFLAVRRQPTPRFTHGYGRLEDLAGVAIVLVILASAIAVGFEAAHRLIHPQPVGMLPAVAAAGLIGFLANEVVAKLRIGVGREIHSAALIADGHHARADGLASLAVAVGAGMVKLGYPIADPLIGVAIAAMILAIVLRAAATVFTRILDGVEPLIVSEIQQAASNVAGVIEVRGIRARWMGHRLDVEAEVAVDSALTVREALAIAKHFQAAAISHLPGSATVRVAIAEPKEAAS